MGCLPNGPFCGFRGSKPESGTTVLRRTARTGTLRNVEAAYTMVNCTLLSMMPAETA